MIVQWSKYEKRKRDIDTFNDKASALNEKSIKEEDNKIKLKEESLIEKEDTQQDYKTSSTYGASKCNVIDSKESRSLNELNLSSISSIHNENESFEFFSRYDLFNDMPVSLKNINDLCSSDYFLNNMSSTIRDKNQLNSLMKFFDNNITSFIKNFFPVLLENAIEMCLCSTSHLLILRTIPYYSQLQTEMFYFHIIKRSFNILASNPYGVEVLNQFIKHSYLNQTIIMDIVKLVTTNIVNLVSTVNSLKVIQILFSLNNYFITNTINRVILSHIIQIALSPNGSEVVKALIESLQCRNCLIQILLQNIKLILIQSNGYLVTKVLCSLNNSQIFLFITSNILLTFPYLPEKERYLNLIAKKKLSFHPIIQAQISTMLNDHEFLTNVWNEKRGDKFKAKIVEMTDNAKSNLQKRR